MGSLLLDLEAVTLKNLFLCFTPLQVLIAKSIIASESYGNEEVELYIFPFSESKRYLHYCELMKPLCSKVELVNKLPGFPFYLKWIKSRFMGSEYNNIFVASIDSVVCQYIVSFSKFTCLKTFDDGTANIIPSSIYYIDPVNVMLRFKKIIWIIFGNKYSRKKLVDKSSLHYTIYPGYENIISNLRAISLIPEVNPTNKLAASKKVSVLLGTVFRDILKGGISEVDGLVKRLQVYLDSVQGDIIYFPHPRDEADYFPGLPRSDSPLVAEESIIDLFKEYEEVDLIGFASSAQFNLIAQPNINNIALDSDLLTLSVRDLLKMLSEKGASLFVIDNN